MELPESNMQEVAEFLNTKLQITCEEYQPILDSVEKRVQNLNEDVVVKQRKRFEILEEKVKEMLEQKTLSGGQN